MVYLYLYLYIEDINHPHFHTDHPYETYFAKYLLKQNQTFG